MNNRTGTPRLRYGGFALLFLCIALTIQCQRASDTIQTAPAAPAVVESGASAPAMAASVTVSEQQRLEAMARRDPLAFANYCLQNCRGEVRDYRVTFTKQETIDGVLQPEQEADVRFRSSPFSVDMTFTRNLKSCARALYVAGLWKDENNAEMAWAKPAGAILRTFVPKIKQPIHGPRAYKESRRTIDQFGFEESLELIILYSENAREEGKLDVKYTGHGTIGGRPTFVFERRLPYTGEEKPYPDRLLVYHIDQEYLVPTACYSYADDEAQRLLGSYVYTNIQMNPGYTAADFDPDQIGF